MRLFTIAYGIWPRNRRIYYDCCCEITVKGGGNQENPNHVNFHLILRAAAPGTVVVIAIDCFPTLPAPEGSRWRSFTPVERV